MGSMTGGAAYRPHQHLCPLHPVPKRPEIFGAILVACPPFVDGQATDYGNESCAAAAYTLQQGVA